MIYYLSGFLACSWSKKKGEAVGVTFKIIGENTKNNFLKEEVSHNHCFFPLLVRTKT